jgi:hypothetical protein
MQNMVAEWLGLQDCTLMVQVRIPLASNCFDSPPRKTSGFPAKIQILVHFCFVTHNPFPESGKHFQDSGMRASFFSRTK